MTGNVAKKEWFPYLDGIRGIAALMVMTVHCMTWAAWDGPIKSAALAVDVFMILSGFLMAYHYREREKTQPWESPKTWYIFYVRRFFRIAPLYYLLMIPSLVFSQQLNNLHRVLDAGNSGLNAEISTPTVDLVHVLTHITFTFGLIPQYAASLAIPDWSLSLEMQFYAVFPFLMLLFKRFSYFWISLSLCIVSFIVNHFWLDDFPQPSFLLFKINFFIIGILLAEAYYFKSRKTFTSICLIVLLIIISGYSRKAEVILFVVALITTLMFYDETDDNLKINKIFLPIKNVLSNRISRFMSDTSYSVYLAHNLLLMPLAYWFYSFPWFTSQPGYLKFIVLFAVVAPLTYCAAFVLFKYVEKPGIVLGKFVLSGKGMKFFNR
jgi:peptidoglycan/LPS O-acetylase OafA/YrhL